VQGRMGGPVQGENRAPGLLGSYHDIVLYDIAVVGCHSAPGALSESVAAIFPAVLGRGQRLFADGRTVSAPRCTVG